MKHFFNGIISIVQSVLGIMVVASFFVTELQKSGPMSIILQIAILAGLAWLVCWMRGVEEMGFLLVIPETVLSPIAVFRHLIGTIAAAVSKSNYRVNFTYDEDYISGDLTPLQRVTLFFFYFYYEGETQVTKLSNILTHIFICLPVTGAMALCSWQVILCFAHGVPDISPLLIFPTCVTCLSALLCAIRGQESSVSFWHGRYEFRDRYGNTATIQARNRSQSWEPTSDARAAGWETTSNGYGEYFTGWMIATILFSPILFFTQAVGFIVSIFASPSIHIISSYTKLDYDDFPLPFIQRIIHFFFNFVFG